MGILEKVLIVGVEPGRDSQFEKNIELKYEGCLGKPKKNNLKEPLADYH